MTAPLTGPSYDRWGVTAYHGDCLEIMRALPDQSVHSVVTDPPAGIAFMGKSWDSDRGGRDLWVEWLTERMTEAFRVLKPGGHALVWALPRTSHWTAWALENVGFEIRDCITHLFGSGFPKSLDASQAIDKAAGVEREVLSSAKLAASKSSVAFGDGHGQVVDITAPVTNAARQWAGWGTALKPASEHWWLVRKPLPGTVAGNVLKHSTGALNISGCRIAHDADVDLTAVQRQHAANDLYFGGAKPGDVVAKYKPGGRWPPNVVLTHQVLLDPDTGEVIGDASAAKCVDGCPVKPDKGNAADKIDGISAMVTAMARGMHHQPTGAPTLWLDDDDESASA